MQSLKTHILIMTSQAILVISVVQIFDVETLFLPENKIFLDNIQSRYSKISMLERQHRENDPYPDHHHNFAEQSHHEHNHDTSIDEDYYDYKKEKTSAEKVTDTSSKKPCAIMLLSNAANCLQSLVRKYRYDANGELIPHSVKYFLKVPPKVGKQEPMMVQLNDKYLSPAGGFVRYYQEVPPILPSSQLNMEFIN